MTAEPRDQLHRLVEEIVMEPGWRAALRAAVAAADRDNAELRGEVEAIWAVVREYLPEAIGHNTLPEIVAGIARQRDGQHEIKDHLADVARKLTDGHKRECYAKLDTEIQRDDLRAQLAAAQAQLAETPLLWSCPDCAFTAGAEHILIALTNALPAAPQPEPHDDRSIELCPHCGPRGVLSDGSDLRVHRGGDRGWRTTS